MRRHNYPLKSGIRPTPEFAKKKLATHAVNVGVKCGHGCAYCSTGAMLRMHLAFKKLNENPFEHGYAIVDPDMAQRVAEDAKRIKQRGLIQLCTTVDAWAPEAKQHNLGRRCLEAILNEPGWQVRILTKNVSVRDDYDLIETYLDRVLVGLSITATPDQSGVIEIIEPNASSIQERHLVVVEAAARGLRTYAMFCPLLPGVADSPDQTDQLIKFAVEYRVEEIFVEPVNPRGPGLKQCQESLELWGYGRQAKAIENIRKQKEWSRYVVELLANTQSSVRRHFDITKLRFLLYPSRLLPRDLMEIREDDAGVVWLGK